MRPASLPRKMIRKPSFYVLTSLLLLLLGSCASDVANRYYGPEKYPAKETAQVELLFAAPTRPYKVIADFQSRGEGAQAMRKKAAKIGADAVIVAKLGGFYDRSTEWAGNDAMIDTYSHITGTAIKFTK